MSDTQLDDNGYELRPLKPALFRGMRQHCPACGEDLSPQRG